MRVTQSFEVVGDGDKPEFSMPVMTWHDCNWLDVTFLQDVMVQSLDRLVAAGYAECVAKGLTTADQIAAFRAIARGETPTVAPSGGPLPRGK